MLASNVRGPDPIQCLALLVLIVLVLRALVALIAPRALRQQRDHAMSIGVIALAFVYHRVEAGRYALLSSVELWNWTIGCLGELDAFTRAVRIYLLPLAVLAFGMRIGYSRGGTLVRPDDAAQWIDEADPLPGS